MMNLCWRHAPLSQLGGAMDPQRAQALLSKYQQPGQDAWFLLLLIDASAVETSTGTYCS